MDDMLAALSLALRYHVGVSVQSYGPGAMLAPQKCT